MLGEGVRLELRASASVRGWLHALAIGRHEVGIGIASDLAQYAMSSGYASQAVLPGFHPVS